MFFILSITWIRKATNGFDATSLPVLSLVREVCAFDLERLDVSVEELTVSSMDVLKGSGEICHRAGTIERAVIDTQVEEGTAGSETHTRVISTNTLQTTSEILGLLTLVNPVKLVVVPLAESHNTSIRRRIRSHEDVQSANENSLIFNDGPQLFITKTRDNVLRINNSVR